jgi:ribosome maturation factor RimP
LAVIKDQLKDVIQPTVEGMGFILWGIEFKHVGRKSFLTVYIDKDGGVTIEDCSDVSRQLSSVLDVEDLITYAYDLEVSSPGMDRLFFELEQFKSYIGEKIEVELNMPVDNRRKFKATLVSVADNIVSVKLDDESVLDIMYPNIKKARLVPDYDFSKKEEK